MSKRLIWRALIGVLGLALASSAWAFFHNYRINEVYSNADGSIQFIELLNGPVDGENFSQGTALSVSPAGGGASHSFIFPDHLPSFATAGTSVLIATQGFANLGIVAPDFIMPDGFLFIGGGTINLGNFEFPIPTYPAMPTDGIHSLTRTPGTSVIGTTTVNSPRNFAGATGTVPALSLTIIKAGGGTVTSSPAGIDCGATCSAGFGKNNPVTLTATPDSGSTFAGWSGDCAGTGPCTLLMSAARSVTATFNAAEDLQAPSAPTGLSAAAASSSQIDLSWNASTDNVGVTHYRIHRDGPQIGTVNAPATRHSDTGLAASTSYSYTLEACDAAGNCSAQSGAASATTLAPGQYAFTAQLEPGFNLIGDSLNVTLDVAATFGNQETPTEVTPNIVSIWKWNAADGRWAFYSPQLTAAGTAVFAAIKSYEVLAAIGPGEGYWVNASQPMTLPLQSGTGFNWNGSNFSALPTGFNLIATADSTTPSQFNLQVSEAPPPSEVIPTTHFLSLWAWDAAQGKWYFHSPLLEASGGLAAVKAYADAHSYLHFQDYNKTLGIGAGFWVNRP